MNCSLSCLLAVLLPALLHAAPPASQWVVSAPDGRLLHVRDSLGNRIIDTGGCGFKAGVEPIPNLVASIVLSPPAGDATFMIQGAINQMAARAPDSSGMRGAILLTAGEYSVSGTLNISQSGIVLRGVGTSESSGTRLRATAAWQHTLVNFAGTGSRSVVSGTTRDIVEKYVPAGARAIDVSDASIYQKGDSVEIFRPSTAAWIQLIGMDQLDSPWTAGAFNITMERVVERVEGNRIFLDAPVTAALDAMYGGGQIRKYVWSGNRLRLCGIEKIAGISNYDASKRSGNDYTDENHGWNFVQFQRAEDCWARDVTSRYFGYSCVNVNSHCRRVSVLNAASRNPVSQVSGGRRYAFNLDDSTLCLFRGCTTHDDRHHFVTGSLTTGPAAFVAGSATAARYDAGPHHRWASGILFDGISVAGNKINIQNRGNEGTGQGWSGANCTVWNSVANGFIVRNPPGARNWLVGSRGDIQSGNQYVGPNPAGTYDSSGTSGTRVFPASLNANQRQDLVSTPALSVREYLVGDRDSFAVDGGDGVSASASWLAQVASMGSISGFDFMSPNRLRPWTHSFVIDDGDEVISATLWVSVRGLSATALSSRIYLNNIDTSQPLSDFLTSLPSGGTAVLRMDLAARLGELAVGKLDVALGPDVAVDWSELELRVAPPMTRPAIILHPEADSMVRGGEPYAAQVQDSGRGPELSVKGLDLRADVMRRALLRWDLTNVIGKIENAEIRLVPTFTSSDTTENSFSLLKSHDWEESTVTWNNQPAAESSLGSWHAVAGRPVIVSVTREVREAIASTGKISLSISASSDHTNNDSATYPSREHPVESLRPCLVIRTGTPLENWRYFHFGTESDVGNAENSADPDGDGVSNLSEFTASSDPTRKTSTPETAMSLKRMVIATSSGIDQYLVGADGWKFDRRICSVTGGVQGIAIHQESIFATTLETPRRIIRVSPGTGSIVPIAVRGSGAAGAAGWNDSDPQGIEVGPDGMLYFSTAFGSSGGEGIFRLNPDGSVVSKFVARSGSVWDLYNARDLEWQDGQLYVSSRGGYNAPSRSVYRFSSSGAYQSTISSALIGPQGLEMEQEGLLVTGSAPGPAALCLVEVNGPFPSAVACHSASDIAAGMEVVDLDGDTFVVTYNTGVGGMGQIIRCKRGGIPEVVVDALTGNGNDMALLSKLTPYELWAEVRGLDARTEEGSQTGDADHDGTTNETEFMLGLDPKDGSARFAISVSGNASSGLTLTWPSQPGRVFEVRSGQDLTDFPVLEAVISASSSPASTTSWSTGPIASGKRFYRIELRPLP